MTSSTATSSELIRFGIYLGKLHFEDKEGIYKVRPLLVVDEMESIVVVLKMSSNPNRTDAYPLDDYRRYGLHVPTVILLDKAYSIPLEDIFSDRLLGTLDKRDSDAIERLLR